MIDFEYSIYISELLTDESLTEKVFCLRFDALKLLRKTVALYEKERFLPELVGEVFCKKAGFIMKATTKTEMEEILKPCTPRYFGGDFLAAGDYYVEEEELILWSRTSLHGPLISEGQKRYEELFQRYVSCKVNDNDFVA